MVSPPSLRRSRRGKQVYSIGDKVEVVRLGGVDIGTITNKVSRKGTNSPGNSSPRWMVTFDEGSQEEISEKGLGRIIGGADSDESAVNSGNDVVRATTTSTSAKTHVVPPKQATTTKQISVAKKPQARKVRQEPHQHEVKKRVLTRAVHKRDGSETLNTGIVVAKKKAPKTAKGKGDRKTTAADETITTVKLLTGTLYLYRGERPRAEFVRLV